MALKAEITDCLFLLDLILLIMAGLPSLIFIGELVGIASLINQLLLPHTNF